MGLERREDVRFVLCRSSSVSDRGVLVSVECITFRNSGVVADQSYKAIQMEKLADMVIVSVHNSTQL